MSKPRKPEVTSKRLARIAGRFLRMGIAEDASETFYDDKFRCWRRIDWADVRAIAASVLTQAPDAPPKRLKRGPGAKPLGKFKRRVNLRVRPRKER